MKLEILSPTGTIFRGEADSVSLPGVYGSFEILGGHAPLIAALQQGKMHYTVSGATKALDIQGGFVEVQQNDISVCVE